MFLVVAVLFEFGVRQNFTEFVSFVNFRCLGAFRNSGVLIVVLCLVFGWLCLFNWFG